MTVKQTMAVVYYFVRYPVVMGKNKTATERERYRRHAGAEEEEVIPCSLECAFTAVPTARKADTCNSYGKPFVRRLQSWNFG